MSIATGVFSVPGSLPGLNVTLPVCSTPCGPSDVPFSAVGTIGVITGVYVVVASVPFVSLPWTVTGFSFPAYVLSVGVNVTTGFPSTTLMV